MLFAALAALAPAHAANVLDYRQPKAAPAEVNAAKIGQPGRSITGPGREETGFLSGRIKALRTLRASIF